MSTYLRLVTVVRFNSLHFPFALFRKRKLGSANIIEEGDNAK